jgi:pimeloyl-ACP methyl ester carboxylesterase
MSKPHIILVPGGWHTPAFFEPITALLQTHGYTVTSLHPPSIGNPNPPKDLTQDIAALQALVTDAIGPGNDVVVVAHSWGGILLSSGLTSFGKKQREERGEKGGVVKCGYMCAFLVPEGVAALDAAGVGDDMSKIRFWWRISV